MSSFSKYYDQIAKRAKDNKDKSSYTLSFRKNFGRPGVIKKTDTDEPYQQAFASWSAVVVDILYVNGSEHKAVTGNIRPEEIIPIWEKTKYANRRLMDAEFKTEETAPQGGGESGKSTSPAFAVTIKLGIYKGQTPGDILTKDPSKKESLLKTREFLSKNAAAYESNKKQMEAIDCAIALMDSGKLTKPEEEEPDQTEITAAASKPIVIFNNDAFKHKGKLDEKGNPLCYKMTITCNPGMTYPYEISISNLYAPMGKGSNGRDVPMLSQAYGRTSLVYRLGMDDWAGIMALIVEKWRAFISEQEKEQAAKTAEASNYFRKSAE